MAKHKSQRALFELLAEQRNRGKEKPDVGPQAVPQAAPQAAPTAPARPAESPAPARPVEPPPVRRVEPPRGEEPAPIVRRPAPVAAPVGPAVMVGGVRLTVYHLAIAAVVVVCLCVLFYLLGARFGGGDGLPVTEKHPTMDEVRTSGVTPGLVRPRPEPPPPPKPPTPKAPPPAEKRVGPEPAAKPPPPAEKRVGPAISAKAPPAPPVPQGPLFRVRIARVEVGRTTVIDDLRAFLAGSGIQTELESRGGYHVLYSEQQFPDKTKSDELAGQINKQLEAYEKQTRRPTSKDAYTVQISEKKE